MAKAMPGAWSAWSFKLTPEAQKVFAAALSGLVGVKYTPMAFATQIVAGTNYCFLCEAKGVYPGATSFPALVYIYLPLTGAPHITSITEIKP